MKFKFSLEKLRQYRKTLEDLAKKELADAEAELKRQQDILNSYYKSIEDTRVNSHHLEMQGGTTSEALKHNHDFIKGQELKIERQRLKIREHLMIVEEKQENLIKASIEYKIIDKLRDKKLETFKEEKRDKETKILDEVNTLRFARERR